MFASRDSGERQGSRGVVMAQWEWCPRQAKGRGIEDEGGGGREKESSVNERGK